MAIREDLIEWIEQFEDDHYEFDVYGHNVCVNLPRETVERVLDISILLVDRVVEAKGDLTTAEYEELEKKMRAEYPDDSSWLLFVVIEAQKGRLFERYKDIEPMIGELKPKGYPMGSAPYLLIVRPIIHELIYAVIRNVDNAKEQYRSLVYTFFIGVLTKGWGEGFGWSKNEEGEWKWKSESNGKERD